MSRYDMIKGIIPPIITPMNEDESFNEAEFRNQIERQIEGGVHGIFCYGTNGECYALNTQEKEKILKVAVDQIKGRVPVYAGTGCITTKETVEMSKRAEALGADILSVITPYFAAVSQDELYEHYKTVAEAVKIPIVLYNIPARTGCSIAPETVAKLAEIDNIVGAKDSSGNWDNLKAYIELTRDKDFAVISGNDSLILSALKEGGVGGIAGCANVYPHNMVAIYEKFKAGDLEGAQAAQDAIASFRACFKYGNPNTIVKTAVGLLGYPVGKCRKPFYSIQGLFQWCLYRKKRNVSQHIIDLVDGLEETYYIADVLPKPKEFQNKAYCYALKKACKSMNDEIGKITEEKQDYQEYVESFVHEIKIPIGALSLTFDNTKNYTLKKETDKIFQLVEQMLYYARSENTEKDYFVKQLQLDEVIHNVILKFRHSLMERKAIINIHDIENVIYTDEKWLTFILSQIVQNAIKYFDKQENKLTIYSQDNGTNILLVIEDNGCGIKASDLSRVFEKGFTGSNRNKANATGMGLYLSKKLCDRLGLKLDIASTEKEYTRLTITFPKGTVHNFSE